MYDMPSMPLLFEYSRSCIESGTLGKKSYSLSVSHQVAYFFILDGIQPSETLVADQLVYYPVIIIIINEGEVNSSDSLQPNEIII